MIVSLEANTASFNSAMDRSAYVAKQSADKIQASLNGITSTIKGMVIAAISIEGINRAFTALKGVYDAEKSLEKMAIRLGTTAGELSALQYAGKKAGIDIDVFNTSIQRMEKNISLAALPAKKTAGLMGDLGEEAGRGSEAFRNLGINAAVLKTLPIKEQLLAISERLKLIPNEADKVRIALDIFGKGGGGMVVMLKAGEKAIDDWILKGKQLGVVLGDSMVKRGADASKSISELMDATKGFGLTLADTVAPPIKLVAEALTAKMMAIRAVDPGLQNLVKTVKDFAEAWAEPTLNALKNGVIGGRIAGLQGAAIGAAAGFAGLTTSLKELGDALQNPLVLAAFGAAAGSRLGAIGAGAGALAGAATGITLGIKRDAKAYSKSQEEDYSGYETPMGDFNPLEKAQIEGNKINRLFGPQSFGSPKGGGKGGGGGLDRMSSIIDTLRKDLSRLTEGSLAEITAWADKMGNEIAKVGEKGADTERALALVAEVEAGKKKKVIEDYELFIAKESGDTYKEIEAQARAWMEKYKGFANSEVEITKIANRLKQEEEHKIESDRDSMLRQYYEGMLSITAELKHQYIWKQKLLALDIKSSHQALEGYIQKKGKGLSPDMADDMKKTLALTNATKKYRLEWESIQETAGLYSQALGSIASGFMGVITGIASGTMTVAQGIVSLLETVQNAILNMIMTIIMKWAEAQIMQMMMSSVTATTEVGNTAAVAGAKAYSAYAGIPFIGIILGAAAAALVMGAIFALKGGIKSSAGGDYQVGGAGLRTVHQDETILPAWAANSWRDIVSRGAMPGGGENGTTVHAPITVTIHPRQEMTQGDYDRHSRMIVKSLNRELGRHGKAPLGPSYG